MFLFFYFFYLFILLVKRVFTFGVVVVTVVVLVVEPLPLLTDVACNLLPDYIYIYNIMYHHMAIIYSNLEKMDQAIEMRTCKVYQLTYIHVYLFKFYNEECVNIYTRRKISYRVKIKWYTIQQSMFICFKY
jgi:hypothetical protein